MTMPEIERARVSRVKRCSRHPGRCALGLVPIGKGDPHLEGPWHFGWDPQGRRWIVISPTDGVRSVAVIEGRDRLVALRALVPELLLAGNDEVLAIVQLSGAFSR